MKGFWVHDIASLEQCSLFGERIVHILQAIGQLCSKTCTCDLNLLKPLPRSLACLRHTGAVSRRSSAQERSSDKSLSMEG